MAGKEERYDLWLEGIIQEPDTMQEKQGTIAHSATQYKSVQVNTRTDQGKTVRYNKTHRDAVRRADSARKTWCNNPSRNAK